MNQNYIQIPRLVQLLRRYSFYKKVGLFQNLYAGYFNQKQIGWVKTWTGMDWLIDPKSDCHRWMIFGLYADPGFWQWVQQHLPQDAVIVDSGANIGQYIPYYLHFLKNCRILAVEPVTELAEWIENCRQHNALEQVTVHRCGLAAQAGEAMIQHADNPLLHGLWSHIDKNGTERVVLRKLDDLLEEQGIPVVDLWKLDVEGYEIEAIHGAQINLTQKTIRAAYIELVPANGHAKNIIALMNDFGYHPYTFKGNALQPVLSIPGKKSDAIFLPGS